MKRHKTEPSLPFYRDPSNLQHKEIRRPIRAVLHVHLFLILIRAILFQRNLPNKFRAICLSAEYRYNRTIALFSRFSSKKKKTRKKRIKIARVSCFFQASFYGSHRGLISTHFLHADRICLFCFKISFHTPHTSTPHITLFRRKVKKKIIQNHPILNFLPFY